MPEQTTDKEIRLWCLQEASKKDGDVLVRAKEYWLFIKDETTPDKKKSPYVITDYDRNPSPMDLLSLLAVSMKHNKEMHINNIKADRFLIPPKFNDKAKETIHKAIDIVNESRAKEPTLSYYDSCTDSYILGGEKDMTLHLYTPAKENKDRLITVYEHQMIHKELTDEVANV